MTDERLSDEDVLRELFTRAVSPKLHPACFNNSMKLGEEGWTRKTMWKAIRLAVCEIVELRRRNRVLLEALEPFAPFDALRPADRKDTSVCFAFTEVTITWGDLRRAAAAVEECKE